MNFRYGCYSFSFFMVSFLSFNGLAESKDFSSSISGSLLAGSIGDAMGKVTEFKSMKEIFSVYPNGVRSFDDLKKNDFWAGHIAPYTDDTAMTKVTLEVLIQARIQNYSLQKTMEEIARAYIKDMHASYGWAYSERAPGNACLKGVCELEKRIKHKEKYGDLWWQAGESHAGGCGSVMRAHPFGLVFYDDVKKAEQWAVEHSKLTHGDPIAQAACAGIAVGVAYAVQQKSPEFIIEKMIEAARRYDKETATMMERAVKYAQKNKYLQNKFLVSKKVFEEFEGWAAHDAIAATIYTFALVPDNLQEAIYLGVHTPGDSDSIASIAGALIGARVGIKELPQDWINTVEGSQELLALSAKVSLFAAEPN